MNYIKILNISNIIFKADVRKLNFPMSKSNHLVLNLTRNHKVRDLQINLLKVILFRISLPDKIYLI